MNTTVTQKRSLFTVKQLTLVGLMAAVLCILSPLALSIPISPVPISLGTLAIYFVISVLGMKLGTISVVIYILLGLAGIPVFAGYTSGPGKLLGPIGGYIIEQLDCLPKDGQSVTLESGIRLVVDRIDKNRIELVHIWLPEKEPETEK